MSQSYHTQLPIQLSPLMPRTTSIRDWDSNSFICRPTTHTATDFTTHQRDCGPHIERGHTLFGVNSARNKDNSEMMMSLSPLSLAHLWAMIGLLDCYCRSTSCFVCTECVSQSLRRTFDLFRSRTIRRFRRTMNLRTE